MKTLRLKVKPLTRVEGDGMLSVAVGRTGGASARFRLQEAPRLFEGVLRGRPREQVPDLAARICGICPAAHQLCAATALEAAAVAPIPSGIRRLRRLLLCGELLESHALHVYLLQAPDFFGCDDGFQVAARAPEAFKRGLRLKKAGNEIVRCLGGREIHPVNIALGGFFRLPAPDELPSLQPLLEESLADAVETVKWTAGFTYPALAQDLEYVASREDDGYPLTAERLVSSRGLNIAVADFEAHFQERQIAHSTALHSRRADGGLYAVGPLARFNLNADRLTPAARSAAAAAGLSAPVTNPFLGIVVRSIEMVVACEEALALIREYRPEGPPMAALPVAAGVGCGAVEAPRGLLYHRYRVDSDGSIAQARIVTPTSQNQAAVEEDLRRLAETHRHFAPRRLKALLEQAVRNYDPCISCAVH